jgi:hypothetical protein
MQKGIAGASTSADELPATEPSSKLSMLKFLRPTGLEVALDGDRDAPGRADLGRRLSWTITNL